jgi:hypothetical protein
MEASLLQKPAAFEDFAIAPLKVTASLSGVFF